MYSTRPRLILGFRGCDQSLVEEVVKGSNDLRASENTFDWLGHGIYFWENSPQRAYEFALTQNARGKLSAPSVLGAVLNLGFCLDLLEFENLQLLRYGYALLKDTKGSSDFPRNKNVKGSSDLLLRDLDCAVIETLHLAKESGNHPPFDSVRGMFLEGEELYPNAGFQEKNHIQICIRNPNCIKGFFVPRTLNPHYNKV